MISNGQQLLRVDEETVSLIDPSISEVMINECIALFDSTSIDVVICEDYDKGVLTPMGIQSIISSAQKRNIPVAVDPKFNQFHCYQGVDLFKPNLKELCEGLNTPRKMTLQLLLQLINWS